MGAECCAHERTDRGRKTNQGPPFRNPGTDGAASEFPAKGAGNPWQSRQSPAGGGMLGRAVNRVLSAMRVRVPRWFQRVFRLPRSPVGGYATPEDSRPYSRSGGGAGDERPHPACSSAGIAGSGGHSLLHAGPDRHSGLGRRWFSQEVGAGAGAARPRGGSEGIAGSTAASGKRVRLALEYEGERLAIRPDNVDRHVAVGGKGVAFDSDRAGLRSGHLQHIVIPPGLALEVLARMNGGVVFGVGHIAIEESL